MKKITAFIVALVALCGAGRAQLYSTQLGKVSFYSSTPVEDIEAISKQALVVFNIEKRELAVRIPNNSFEFKNKLMQEHFNEKYMESEKYPNSSFKGKIQEPVDLTQEGEYPVTVVGTLNVHGVDQERKIQGMVVVKNGVIMLKSDFKVLVKDHKITIPSLVVTNIAEEIAVKVDAVLSPRK